MLLWVGAPETSMGACKLLVEDENPNPSVVVISGRVGRIAWKNTLPIFVGSKINVCKSELEILKVDLTVGAKKIELKQSTDFGVNYATGVDVTLSMGQALEISDSANHGKRIVFTKVSDLLDQMEINVTVLPIRMAAGENEMKVEQLRLKKDDRIKLNFADLEIVKVEPFKIGSPTRALIKIHPLN